MLSFFISYYYSSLYVYQRCHTIKQYPFLFFLEYKETFTNIDKLLLIVDKTVADVQNVLETIYKKTLQHFPLTPLQKCTQIPFEMFSAPLMIREELDFKEQQFKRIDEEPSYKYIVNPEDLFDIDGRPAERIYLVGEAGRGKTGQCYQLVHHWIQARLATTKNTKLSGWQSGLAAFDLLFFVTLRHVDENDNNRYSIVKLVSNNLFKMYPHFRETIREILTGGLQTCKCLIILDGVDEMKGELDIDVNISQCTLFMTMRSWKFYYLSSNINDRDRVVEVLGIGRLGVRQVISKVLVNYFKMDQSTHYFSRKVDKMVAKIQDAKFKSLMNIPLLLTSSIHLWQTKTSDEGSMTCFFTSLVNLLIKIALDNGRLARNSSMRIQDTNIVMPVLLRKHRTLKYYLPLLLELGKIAYEDLVIGLPKYNKVKNQPIGNTTGSKQLVFKYEDLEDRLGENMLTAGLAIGLLSQCSAPGSFDEENVSISFFHKTVEEYLAALYISCGNEVNIDSVFGLCSSLESLMRLSSVLIFVVGLDASLGSIVSKHIAVVAGTDEDIVKYRKGYYSNDSKKSRQVQLLKVKLLCKIVCDCFLEMKYSQELSTVNIKTKFYVSDIYIDLRSNSETMMSATELISEHGDGIVSLYIDDVTSLLIGKINTIPTAILGGFLKRTTSLQLLHFDRDYALPRLQISGIYPTLTAFSLCNVTLNSQTARALQCGINHCTNLNVLRLQIIGRVQGARTCPIISLDLNNNKHLISLDISGSFAANEFHVRLLAITNCTGLMNCALRRVYIEDVYKFQSALSSFSQLREITLEDLKPTDLKINKYSINLTSCTKLMALSIIRISIGYIDINPINLRKLDINNISCSVRSLLLKLPYCLHLTYLGIESLHAKEDAKLLVDLLPKLTHLPTIAYSGNLSVYNNAIGVEICNDNDHASVVQAMTKMIGLESLSLWNIDMGDMALKFTSRSTRLKKLGVVESNMTAASWREFIASLSSLQHGFMVDLFKTNIDNESVSVIRCSPHFNVKTDDADGKYRFLRFSKIPTR